MEKYMNGDAEAELEFITKECEKIIHDGFVPALAILPSNTNYHFTPEDNTTHYIRVRTNEWLGNLRLEISDVFTHPCVKHESKRIDAKHVLLSPGGSR